MLAVSILALLGLSRGALFDELVPAIDTVTPSYGCELGGTRLSITGRGFTTDFFAATNEVFIGTNFGQSSESSVACDVIEGACSVDCGSSKRIVCDTRAWPSGGATGWLDMKVQVTRDRDVYSATRTQVFAYRGRTDALCPAVTSLSVSAATAGQAGCVSTAY